jgi:hypothetical protein
MDASSVADLLASPPNSPLIRRNSLDAGAERRNSLDSQTDDMYQWLLSNNDQEPFDEVVDPLGFQDGHVSKAPSGAGGSSTTKKQARQKQQGNGSSAKQHSKKSEKTLSRLEKNRQSARDCRKRKKQRVQELEERVQRLERNNQELRVQLKIGRDSAEADEAEKWRITDLIRSMVEQKESDTALAETIDMFKERYADYGQERRSSIRYHIDQLEGLLQPTTVTKMGLWSLHQEDEFYEDNQGKKLSVGQSIWNILCQELEVKDAQKRKIMSYRSRIRGLCGDLKTSLHLLSDLRGRVEAKNTALEREMQEIQEILTPNQSAKFILWVSDNPACMQMLEQLWTNMHSNSSSTADEKSITAAATETFGAALSSKATATPPTTSEQPESTKPARDPTAKPEGLEKDKKRTRGAEKSSGPEKKKKKARS